MTVGGTQGSGVRATGPLGPAREAPPEADGAASDALAGRDPAGEAWLLLQELFVSRRPVLIAIAAELGLSPPGALALRHLDPDRPATMGELAQQLCYDNSNVTGIVDRLERLGYVERRANPLDRRVKLVHVTRAGDEARRRLLARMSEPPPELARLPEPDQLALRDALRRALAG